MQKVYTSGSIEFYKKILIKIKRIFFEFTEIVLIKYAH